MINQKFALEVERFFGHFVNELKLTNKSKNTIISYNTTISAFMICVNELGSLKCYKRTVLEKLVVLIAPFAPHLAEELWAVLGNTTTVCNATWPVYEERYLVEDTINYTISFNGKARFQMAFEADADAKTIEAAVLSEENTQKWIDGKPIRKIIVVPKKIVNIVC